MLVPGTISGQLPGRYLAFGKTISLRDDILTCGQDDGVRYVIAPAIKEYCLDSTINGNLASPYRRT